MRSLHCVLSAPPLLVLSMAGCLHATTSSASATAANAVSAIYPLAGAGLLGPAGTCWDLLAVDSQRHHLFVSRGDRVQVMDTVDGRLVGTLSATDGIHGIVIVRTLGRGFTTNGRTNTLSVVHEDDANHFRVVQTLATQRSARTMVIDPNTHQLYLPAADFEAQPKDSHQRAAMVEGSFRVLAVSVAGQNKH